MGVDAMQDRLRIGDVAELTGCTPRAIRYWEEVGLLPGGAQPSKGRHRTYGRDDVDRIRALVRTRELLGINLDELREAYETELSRDELRERWHAGDLSGDEQEHLLHEVLGHVDVQLRLVRDRIARLRDFEAELVATRTKARRRLAAVRRQ
jgi:DNA-binding transcriptional MerR regulator